MRHVAGMAAALRAPRLTDDEVTALAIAARADQAARDRLVLSLMGLVVGVARRYRALGEDAYGEASVALLEAIDTFDAEMGHFRTWAGVVMLSRVTDAARREGAYQSRMMAPDSVGDETEEQVGARTPEFLLKAIEAGDITRRQATILVGVMRGEHWKQIAGRVSLRKSYFFEERRTALEALKKHVR